MKNKWGNIEEVIKKVVEEYKEDYVVIGRDLSTKIREDCGNDIER